MKLVDNAAAILKKSHSMWAVYLGLLFLIAPEGLFYFFSVETNPIVIWFGAGGCLIYGAVGRVKDQGLSQ